MDNEKIKNFIVKSRSDGVPDAEIFKFLDSKGVVPKEVSSKVKVAVDNSNLQTAAEGNTRLEQFAVGVAKGEAQTVKGLGTLGAKILSPIEKGIDSMFGNKTPSLIADVYKPGTESEQVASQVLEARTPLEKVGKGTEQIAEFAIPGSAISKAQKGAPAVAKIAGQVASDVGVGIVQKGSMEGAGKQAIISGLFSSVPVVGSLIGKKLAPGIKGLSTNLEEINLRLSPTDKLSLQKSQPGLIKFLASKKVTGTPAQRFQKVDALYNEFEDKIQNTLASSNVKYTKEEVLSKIRSLPDEFLDQAQNPEVYSRLQRDVKTLESFINKQKGEFIEASRLNQFKRSYAKNARNKAGDVVTNESREALSDGLYSVLLKDIPELQPINKEYGQVILSKKLLGKALGRNELGLIGNMISLASGASIGSAIGGPVGGGVGVLAGPALGKQLAGTRVRSIIGSKAEELSKYLETVKPDEAGNLLIPRSILNGLFSD